MQGMAGRVHSTAASACLEDIVAVDKLEARVRGLQVVEPLAHVAVCGEDDRLQPVLDIGHLACQA